MAKFRYQHIKSSVEGKAPTAAQIKVAEIGVNDFAGDEKLFIKNSENTVVDFPRGYSREYIDEIERVTSSSLNDLEARKLDATAYTPTDLSNYYQKNETSGKTEIQDALDGKSDTGHTHDDRYYTETELDDLLASKANTATTIAGYGITDAYTKTEVDTLVEPYADAVKYNSTSKYVEFYHGGTGGTKVFEYDASPFLIDGMVESVAVTSITSGGSEVRVLEITWNSAAGSQVTDIPLSDIFDPSLYYTKAEIDENERVIAASLNDLNTRKLDATAYTPTDLSNYYQKNETSGATELTTAFGNKADTATTIAGYGITDAYTKSETSGKTEIQDALDGKSDTGHTHDDRYYTETEIDTLLANKANTATTYTKSETSGATELSTEFALYVKKADIDQTIDSTTSASTRAVSTSAVYDFVTSYTPSITVDQVIDDTTSGSTNPVSTKAVYSAMTENELVWANAYVTLSGEIKTHVEDTNVHLTTSEKNGLGKASGITSMDGYQIASTAAAIDPLVDTLLTAIAKLEKRIEVLEGNANP